MLQQNFFVERILPASVARGLTGAEMEVYRRPYLEPGESRRPTLTCRARSRSRVSRRTSSQSCAGTGRGSPRATSRSCSSTPTPGAILVGEQRESCRSWPNQRELTVPGIHFVQEDSPHEIGEALATWLREAVAG